MCKENIIKVNYKYSDFLKNSPIKKSINYDVSFITNKFKLENMGKPPVFSTSKIVYDKNNFDIIKISKQGCIIYNIPIFFF
jgi:hypothetical protein